MGYKDEPVLFIIHIQLGCLTIILAGYTGYRAFPVAAARAWNALPDSVRTSSSYMVLRRLLKTLLFKASFGDDRT